MILVALADFGDGLMILNSCLLPPASCLLPVLSFVVARYGINFYADGRGTVTSLRLYQFIRQGRTMADHTFSIAFLDPLMPAYAFPFG